jgi:excisionase family DNA binding protein
MEALLTIADLAAVLKVTEKTVRKYVLENSIPYIKIVGAVRFVPTEIEQWIEGRRKNTNLLAKKK